MIEREEETRGMAVATFGLMYSTLVALRRRELLSGEEVRAIFDSALSGFETQFPVDEPSIQAARHILEETAGLLSDLFPREPRT
jgi:hypothetical protein